MRLSMEKSDHNTTGHPPASNEHRSTAAGSDVPEVSVLEICGRRLHQAIPSFSYGGAVFELLGCHASRTPAGTEIRLHRHSYTEIILLVDGEAWELTPPGGQLRAGMIQAHAPGVPHAWSSTDRALLRLGLWLTVQPALPITLPATWPIHPEMTAAIHALVAETSSRLPGWRERLLARLILLLAPALELFSLPEQTDAPSPADTPPTRDTLAYVERFLSDNLAEPLTLQDVAAQLTVSVPSLTRHFRQAAGCSVMTRLQELRMRRAVDLLREGKLSVKQIAAAVGIPDPGYFCRCFRKAYGCTPLTFKEEQAT